MEDKQRTRLAWIGLIIGFVAGSGLNYLSLLINNWLSTWTKLKPVEITVWNVIPLGILMGLAMGAAIKSGVFGD